MDLFSQDMQIQNFKGTKINNLKYYSQQSRSKSVNREKPQARPANSSQQLQIREFLRQRRNRRAQ